MPYKIYTYVDPYRIAETEFWDEIREYPQLCASRTLVNGLVSVMGKAICSLICPFDELSEKKVFGDWSLDISRQIQQYSYLTQVYRELRQGKEPGLEMDEDFYCSVSHNKAAMLDSLRLFQELHIEGTKLHPECGNREQRLFVYLLRTIQQKEDKLFALPAFPHKRKLISYFMERTEKEKQEYLERINRREEVQSQPDAVRMAMYERAIDTMSRWDGNHVVVHGIHQFTPMQLRFIEALDRMGTEVIFLYNYIPQYQEIYSSWNYIYQQFNVSICSDTRIKSYQPTRLSGPGNALAINMALLCEDSVSRTDPRIRDNYRLYSDAQSGISIQEFANVSEYAGYVSDRFGEAEQRVQEEPLLYQMPLRRHNSTAKVLAEMDEAFYTANKDVDELLQIYHPEYARNRHFLAYPIGQFFVALYGLWNCEKGQINMDFSLIRECVNAGVLPQFNAAQLLKTATNLETEFDNLEGFDDFVRRMKGYIELYDSVAGACVGSLGYPLRVMEIYNKYKVDKQDAENLLAAVTAIDEIARTLFLTGDDTQDFVEFRAHFARLEQMVRNSRPKIANEEERNLIDGLLSRLASIKPSTDSMSGTFEDLKSGLYFFLKQREEPDSNWFVKNFEQIDGDILQSRGQNRPGRRKTYHFACVSDRDMHVSRNELLPWPLTEQFIERAYTPKDLAFQVYYAAIGERSNFLRYALFYGLYFNQCDAKISYVRKYGDEETTEYGYLKLLGVKKSWKDGSAEEDSGKIVSKVYSKPVLKIKYQKEQMETAFLCPYRYFMDYVLNPYPIESGTFLYQKLLENVLVENVWKRLEEKPVEMARTNAHRLFQEEKKKIENYFPFFMGTELYDIAKRAENYFINCILSEKYSSRYVRKCDFGHMSIRERFGKAKFSEELNGHQTRHVIEAFESRTEFEVVKKEERIVYSLNKIPKQEDNSLSAGLVGYLNNPGDDARVGEWCIYCPDKSICLQPFIEQET